MCGLHAINSLLQGPFFDEVSLSAVAWKLDEEEKQLLGITDEVLSWKDETNNVANDGNYNIQVLTSALQSTGNYEISNISKKAVKDSMENV